jgi:hypothetical protein
MNLETATGIRPSIELTEFNGSSRDLQFVRKANAFNASVQALDPILAKENQSGNQVSAGGFHRVETKRCNIRGAASELRSKTVKESISSAPNLIVRTEKPNVPSFGIFIVFCFRVDTTNSRNLLPSLCQASEHRHHCDNGSSWGGRYHDGQVDGGN